MMVVGKNTCFLDERKRSGCHKCHKFQFTFSVFNDSLTLYLLYPRTELSVKIQMYRITYQRKYVVGRGVEWDTGKSVNMSSVLTVKLSNHKHT